MNLQSFVCSGAQEVTMFVRSYVVCLELSIFIFLFSRSLSAYFVGQNEPRVLRLVYLCSNALSFYSPTLAFRVHFDLLFVNTTSSVDKYFKDKRAV